MVGFVYVKLSKNTLCNHLVTLQKSFLNYKNWGNNNFLMARTIPIDHILEAGYNVRLLVEDFDGLINTWSARSEKFRSTVDSSLNCQYDEGEKNKLDLFRCGKPNAPLYVFVHGGYWQRGDKSVYSFIAESFVKSGIDVALIGYQSVSYTHLTLPTILLV